MRKRYLFLLMLLFPIATMFYSGKAHAADPDKALYDAAMAAITDGKYYLVAEVDGNKFYLTQDGSFTDMKEYAYVYSVSKVSGGALYDVGILLDPGNGSHYSNTTLTGSVAELHPGTGKYRQDESNNRNDWERQVFYLNAETGKFAIRSCNTAYGESSWADAGRAFWTYEVEDVDGEIVPVYDEMGYPKPCYSYEPTYMWSFEEPAERDQVKTVIDEIITDYDSYYWDPDGESLNLGTERGQRPDVETYNKLVELIGMILDISDKFEDENFGPGDPDFPTLDQAKAWRTEADSLYNKVYYNVIPYTIPQDGYYRIVSPLRYYTDTDIKDPDTGDVIDTERQYVKKVILASYDEKYPNGGMFGTFRDNLANQVWKLTQHGDSVEVQNVGMETYISMASAEKGKLMLTDDETQKSHVVFDWAGMGDVPTVDGLDSEQKEIFYIRLASKLYGGGNYVHQNGHNKGKDSGKDLELTFWYGTYEKNEYYDDYTTDKGTSEWYLEPVSEEEVEELIKAFEPIKNHDVLVQRNQELRDEVRNAIADAKDSKMIATAGQISSPHSDSSEGTNLGALIDGDKTTFWHSDWHGEKPEGMHFTEPLETEPEDGYHYLLFSGMEDMKGECELYFCQRSTDNDHPKTVYLFGSAEANAADDAWTQMAIIEIPNTGSGQENTIPFSVETAFPYVRFVVTDCVGTSQGFRRFWHAAEIQLTLPDGKPNSQFVALGEIATNLEKILNENCAVADEDVTVELYNQLLEAYELFKGGLVDPTELRNALATYSNTTKGVVEGTEPGQWTSTDIAKAYNRLYAEAKAYNEAGKYTAEQIHQYAVQLKAMSKTVAEQANGIKTGTWYRIMFPTEEMYDAYGFDKSGAGKSGLVEEQAYQWGNFVAAAQEVKEDGEPDEEGNPTTVTRLETLDNDGISDATRLFFMADDEIENKDVSKFRFVERPQEKANYSGLFNEVMENAAVAFDLNTSYTRGEALITDVSQLSSNASDPSEGQHLEYLIDGDKSTFWHSDWHQQFLAPPYLQVALNEPVSGTVQIEVTRRSNDFGHIVHMFIQGSTDGENWTNVGYMAIPYGAPSEVVSTPAIDLGGTYSYLRFINTRRAGLDIEMDPFAVITNKNQYQVDYTYFHSAEFQIYPVKANKELSANGKALQETYNTLHKVVNIYREPTAEQFAAANQAYKAYQSEYNTSVGKAVLPNGADKPAASYAIQNKATGLFINAKQGKTNDLFLKLTPTFFDYSAPGYERSLLHGVNLDGTDCTNLHSGNSNHRLCTWDVATPQSNSGLVIREAEAVEPAEFNFNLSIKAGEIYDFCAPVSVTNKGEGIAYVGLGKYTDDNEDTYLALKKVETIEAGTPAFYIFGDTADFDAEVDAELIPFTMPAEPDFKLVGDTINGFMACLVNHTLDVNDIFFDDNAAGSTGKTGYYQPAPCVIVDSEICPDVDPAGDYDFAILLWSADVVDGIQDVSTSIQKVSQPGAVYSLDGKLLRTNATLNTLKSLGKGMYILNGVKVAVK